VLWIRGDAVRYRASNLHWRPRADSESISCNFSCNLSPRFRSACSCRFRSFNCTISHRHHSLHRTCSCQGWGPQKLASTSRTAQGQNIMALALASKRSNLNALASALVMNVHRRISFWYLHDISTETLKLCQSDHFLVHYDLNKMLVLRQLLTQLFHAQRTSLTHIRIVHRRQTLFSYRLTLNKQENSNILSNHTGFSSTV